jgi:hypothetical protein
MKKLFIKLSMILCVLGMSTTAWANMDIDFDNLDPEIKQALTAASVYSARLTGRASSTGGGKVYVNTTSDPRGNDYEEGTSNVATNSWAISLPGMDVSKVYIYAWAKPDAGYRLQGWSFTNEGVDLGIGELDELETPVGKYTQKYDVSTVANDTVDYVIYATFEPVRFIDYAISGVSTTSANVCEQTVTFMLSHRDITTADFNAPTITSSKGGGNWTSEDGDAWTTTDLTVTDDTVRVKVKFTAPNASAAEYSANLQLQTVVGITMNVPLNARTVVSGVQAIRYNQNKVQYEGDAGQGTLSDMLNAAVEGDIIKLNADYSDDSVTIRKKITFDLNGYTLTGTLAIDNDVTLAFSPYGGTVNGNVTVAAGHKLILNGDTITGAVTNYGTLEQNGATIRGAIENHGTMITTDGVHAGALTNYNGATLTVNGGAFETSGVTITNNGVALIKKGTIVSTGASALFTQAKGNTTVEKLAILQGGVADIANNEGGKLNIRCGKFSDPSTWLASGSTITSFQSAYFQTNSGELNQVEAKPLWRNTSGVEYRERYYFFVGELADAQAAGVSVCHISAVSYSSLEDALAYANNTSDKVTIIMDNNYTLPAGYYTLPSNATLIVPMSNDQNSDYKIVNKEASTSESDWTNNKPFLFRKLTLEKGVNFNVHGTIEVSGSQFSSNKSFTGASYGPYGQIQMNPGSKIVLQDQSELRAWGYVTGDIEHLVNDSVLSGEIDARRGAMVRELFQMGDWKGAMFSAKGLVQGDSVFPINTYFIQNVEVPVKYHPGARLSTTTTVHEGVAGIVMSANDIQIIGVSLQDVAMFLMDANADQENTWVRKFYDAKHDKQVYEINSGAHIGQLVISLMSSPLLPHLSEFSAELGSVINGMTNGAGLPENVVMNSAQYFLPITNNFKLHVLTGELGFTQSTALLPGSEVEIDKEAMVTIAERRDGVKSGSLFVYDWREWGNYAGGQPGRIVKYSPMFGGAPDKRDVSSSEAIGSACINVHGSFDTKGGYVLTTEHGANIYSSVEDAGTFIFSYPTQAAGYSEEIKQYNGSYQAITCYPVWLRNNNNPRQSAELDSITNAADYVQTAGEIALGGESFCYLDIDGTGGKWTKLEDMGCFTYDEYNDTYYIKPQEYVAVTVDEYLLGNADHTYSDAAGAGRLFILLTDENGGNCQWWEVEQKKNYYHCIHPENDTYYEWWDDPDKDDPQYGEWKEKKFTITWKDKKWGVENTPDTILQTYQVPYGTQAEWLSTNPTRPASVDYTYDFTGWCPALDKVTSDVTYTATYEEKQIKYTVTFVQDGGMEIERHLLARNEMPVCENVPTRTGYILQWEPALAAVTHDTTYVATWLPEPPTEFAIRFVDYDGKTELKKDSVEVGTMPTPPAIVDGKPQKEDESFGGKPATAEYTYVFDHWSPALEEVSVTSAKVYTAVYREEAQTYTIYYYKENGTTLDTTEVLPYGATPTPPTVSKESPEEGHTYTLVWKTLDASGTIQTVTGDASYKPTYIDAVNKYTVSVRSNPAGACEVWGSGIYEYDDSEDAIEVGFDYDSEEWTFAGWSDNLENNDNPRQMAVTGDITLVANFTYNGTEETVTITWKNGDDELASNAQPKETPTVYTGETPTKPASAESTYNFDGWATTKDGALAYKKGQTPWATEDATYYAHFAATPAKYTISWMNEAGTSAIEVDYDQPYGETTVFNGAAPTKQATAAATFTFDGWATEANGEKVYNIGATPAVSGAASYYAHFATVPRTYTITWLDENGGLIDQTTEEYSLLNTPTHAKPTKAATAQYTYTFTDWNPTLTAVTGAATYTATFSQAKRKYTITWLNDDNSEIGQTEVEYGVVPTHADATKDNTAEYSYTFTGWDTDPVAVTGAATYKATFSATKNSYEITWLNDDNSLIDKTIVEYGVVPTHADATKDNTAEYTYTFAGWDNTPVAVTGAATYKATFSSTVNTYTITWKNWDGTTLETDENVAYGTTPSYDGEELTKEEDEQNTYEFNGWTPTVVPVAGNAEYTAQFNAIPKINNMEIGITETETLTEPTTRDNLVITSNGSISGELVGAENLTLSGAAYFDLVLNAQSHVWYAVAVPWQVDAETGISVNGNTLTLGVDFDLLYYNGELRASQGVNQAWNYVENDANKTMQPGRLYMIGLMLDAPVIRFAKKSTAAILTTSTSVTEYASAVASDANWNGIANPALFHAYLNAGTEEGQIYDANAVGYNLITLNTHKLAVGQPVFVQAPHTKSVVVTYGGPFAAPSHAQTQENTKYEVQIASEEGALTDRLFIKIDEDKSEDTYVIGKDLAKMGVSSKVAQLWVNRYNAKLCVNTQAPVNGVAEYPLGIYAPVSGNYTISCQNTALSGQNALYLTYDGQVVANLTQNAYTITLNAGTDVHYALRVGTTSDDATGMDEIIVDALGQTRKVLVNDHVFIIRGDKVYTIDGQLVK